jgi:hypothetical protein
MTELGIDKLLNEEDDEEKPKEPVDLEFELGLNP